MVRAELAAHAQDGSERVRVDGPEVQLTARQVQNFALALHELTTNAVKYGALSVPDGRVNLSWSVLEGEDGPALRLSWRELGGPPVEPPPRKGFGTRLIERGLTGQVGGVLAINYPPEGVTCVVEAPLRNFQDDG